MWACSLDGRSSKRLKRMITTQQFIIHYDRIFGPIEARRIKITTKKERRSVSGSSSSNSHPLASPPSPTFAGLSSSANLLSAPSASPPLRDRERRKSSSSFHRVSVMRSSADASDHIKSGIMTVHTKKKWSTRFCVLQQGSLTIYKGHKERRATSKLLLIGHQVFLSFSPSDP